MTTNRTTAAARFFASPDASHKGQADKAKGWPIIDRTDDRVVGYAKGRAAARTMAATLSAINPEPRTDEPVKATSKGKAKAGKAAKAEAAAKAQAKAARTSHADCAHASSKLARAICRRDRAKADA